LCTLETFQAESNISIFQIDKKFVELWNHLGHQMSTASRNTLLQVFQDKTNRILTPVVDKIINHSTKELRLDILPQTMAKDLENIVDLDHELHKPSGVERKRKELENNQNSGIVIFQDAQQCIN
jgi:hypothetical protein